MRNPFHVVEWAMNALRAMPGSKATNNKIKLIIRKAYGFRNMQNMMDMVYLVCSNIAIPLPNRKPRGSHILHRYPDRDRPAYQNASPCCPP
ncbi:transposase [Lachnoclostridium sp. Marseille-P6806]|uniref:transposase n=1 Tax=Lachnoclostridium sp. Marseille-P6806 TaxID=2364793 RepID=UPI001030D363